MLLRARILLPVSQPPIVDGAVLISGDRIAAVGPWGEMPPGAARVEDLGDVVLMPGLVNAHCHLDYTDMAGQPAPKQFPDWIKGLAARKSGTTYSDYAHAWLRGAEMLRRTGTTTVADIEAVPELLPEVWSSTPLRVFSFLEMTGVLSRRDPGQILGEADAKIASLAHDRCAAGLSPHALYSTTPALLHRVAELAPRHGRRVTMHVAESVDEFEMFARARGALFDWLRPQRDHSDCGHGTPTHAVAKAGLLNAAFLAVHANYLEPADIQLLARAKSSVVHCPRSHAYFRHAPFLHADLARAGVNVCLGTDSLASVTRERGEVLELNMFAEMRAFASAHAAVPPADIVAMATCHGARALGWGGLVGELKNGAWADLIAVPYHGPVAGAEAAVVNHRGAVVRSMIGGRWTEA